MTILICLRDREVEKVVAGIRLGLETHKSPSLIKDPGPVITHVYLYCRG